MAKKFKNTELNYPNQDPRRNNLDQSTRSYYFNNE